MAKILTVTLQGIAGRDAAFNFPLDPKINVFFGRNGSGKTTLLRVLYSALRNDCEIIKFSAVTAASVVFMSLHRTQVFTRDLTKVEVLPDDQIVMSYEVEGVKAPTESITVWKTRPDLPGNDDVYAAQFLPVSRLYTESVSSSSQLIRNLHQARLRAADPAFRDPTLESAFIEGLNAQWASYSNTLLANIKSIQQNGLSNILQTVLSTTGKEDMTVGGDPAAAYMIAKPFFEREPGFAKLVRNETQFKSMYSKNPNLRAIIRIIEQVEKEIAEKQGDYLLLQETLNKLFLDKKVILTDTAVEVRDSNNNPLRVEQLSTGEKQLLKLCVQVLSVNNCPVLIDEPEISLHIDWQHDLLQLLSTLNPTVQLIAATHSPEIMANIADKQIFKL